MKKISSSQIIAIGTLFILCGLLIFSSQYILNKKNSLFEYINMQLYFDQMNDVVEDPVEDPVNPTPEEPEEPAPEVITENYIGVLEIPKIDLKKGLYDINSRYNTVSRNVMILSPSDYPDVDKGNFILAAHSGNGYLSFFRNLYKLSIGDYAYVYYNNVKYSYEIVNIYYEQKTGKIAIRKPVGKTTLMMITCTKNDETTQTVYVAELRSTEHAEGY